VLQNFSFLLQLQVSVIAHEIIEAVTDPDVRTGLATVDGFEIGVQK
jgi:hypothetical protein